MEEQNINSVGADNSREMVQLLKAIAIEVNALGRNIPFFVCTMAVIIRPLSKVSSLIIHHSSY